MESSECRKEKLSQHLQLRESKPFVDANLQFHVPAVDFATHSPSYRPIYTHYMHGAPSDTPYASEVNEAELFKAISDAELSYQSWQEMKEKLQQLIR